MKRRHIEVFVLSAAVIGVAAFAALLIKSPSQPTGSDWSTEAAAIVQAEAPDNLVELRFTGRENTQLCLLKRQDGRKAQINLDGSSSGDPFLFAADKTDSSWAVSDSVDMSRPRDISVDDFHQLVHDCISQSNEVFERQSEAHQKENEASWARAAQDRAEGHPHHLATPQSASEQLEGLSEALTTTMGILMPRMIAENRKMAGIAEKGADSTTHEDTVDDDSTAASEAAH